MPPRKRRALSYVRHVAVLVKYNEKDKVYQGRVITFPIDQSLFAYEGFEGKTMVVSL